MKIRQKISNYCKMCQILWFLSIKNFQKMCSKFALLFVLSLLFSRAVLKRLLARFPYDITHVIKSRFHLGVAILWMLWVHITTILRGVFSKKNALWPTFLPKITWKNASIQIRWVCVILQRINKPKNKV